MNRGRKRAHSTGPRLPAALSKELDGDVGRPGVLGGGRRGGSRKLQRKAAREQKKQRRNAFHSQRNHQHQHGAAAGTIKCNNHVEDKEAAPSNKRRRLQQAAAKPDAGARSDKQPAQKPGASSKSKFYELLTVGWESKNTADAYDAELQYQRRLEKKLGMKQGAVDVPGPDDGLGGLLKGISSAGAPATAAAAGGALSDDDSLLVGFRADDGGNESDMGEDGLSDGSDLSGGGGDDDDDSEMDLGGSDGQLGSSQDMEEDEDEDHDGGVDDTEPSSDINMGDDSNDLSIGDDDNDDDNDGGGGLLSDDVDSASKGSGGDGSDEEDGMGSKGNHSAKAAGTDSSNGTGGAVSGLPGQPCSGDAAAAAAAAKYVSPALRARLAGEAGGAGADGNAALQRRITGLLNRLAEANLQGIARDIALLYQEYGRRVVTNIVSTQILTAVAEGPRATEQFAAVAAAFIAGLSATANAQDIAANFLQSLAERVEQAYAKRDSLAQRNLALLLAYCYSYGLIKPDIVYSLLDVLRSRFTEADITLLVTLLNACGLQLRGDEPAAMKDFIISVHAKAAEQGKQGQLSKRAQMMLDLIINIKNNKGKEAGRGGTTAVLNPNVSRWLRQSGVEEVQLRNLTWAKLLAKDKKGMWWMPAAGEVLPGAGRQQLGAGSSGRGLPLDGTTDEEMQRLLQLAAAYRMNTDTRRAVFCAIMGSEDCIEAFEKLMRLSLKNEQEREIVRVLVHCCLHEKSWNPYYAYLALKLCQHGKSHRLTLQYCLWDQYKLLAEMPTRQLVHLARFNALLLAKFSLSLSMLKVIDFSDLWPKPLFFWRILFQHLLLACKDINEVKEVFARVAMQRKQLSSLITSLTIFLRTQLGPWLAAKGTDSATSAGLTLEQANELLLRARAAEKVLAAASSAAAVTV